MKDRAKAFALICFGLMCLTFAYNFEVEESQADVNPAGNVFAQHEHQLLTTAGHVYRFEGEWVREAEYDPPIPVAEIAMWSGQFLVSTSGEGWFVNQVWEWVNMGEPIPTSAPEETPDNQSMSNMKDMFGR